MSEILDMLMKQMGGAEMGQLAGKLGIGQEQAGGMMEAALPVILGQVMKNSRSGNQSDGLRRAIEKDHDGSILDNIGSFLDQGPSDRDNRLLGHLFGNRQQAVERQLSNSSGLDMAKVTQMLATFGPLVMGAIGKLNKQKPDDLGSILGREREQLQRKNSNFGLVERMLDDDGDGDVDLGDLMKKGGGLLGSLFK